MTLGNPRKLGQWQFPLNGPSNHFTDNNWRKNEPRCELQVRAFTLDSKNVYRAMEGSLKEVTDKEITTTSQGFLTQWGLVFFFFFPSPSAEVANIFFSRAIALLVKCTKTFVK